MKTVLVHGVFDILHYGHIRFLEDARDLGDELTVSLLSDKYAAMYKRVPFHSLAERFHQVTALRCVTRAVVVDGPGHEAVEAMIAQVRPQIYVKGEDTRGKFGEEPFLRKNRIKLIYLPMHHVRGDVVSTTRILNETSIHHK